MVSNIGVEIGEALGFEPSTVKAIEIRMTPPGVYAEVTVETVLRAESAAAGRLVTALRRYELRPKEAVDGEVG